MVSRVRDSEQQPPKPQRSLNKLGSTPTTWIIFMWQSETGCRTRWDMPARAANVRNTTFLASQWHSPSLFEEVYEHVLVNNYPPWPAPAPAKLHPGSSSASRSQHLLKIDRRIKKKKKAWDAVCESHYEFTAFPPRIAWARRSFCFHRKSWENSSFFSWTEQEATADSILFASSPRPVPLHHHFPFLEMLMLFHLIYIFCFITLLYVTSSDEGFP